MDEFKLSAFPRFAQGGSRDAIAAVSAPTLAACFSAMAAEVGEWLPRAVKSNGGHPPPEAIELTLEWTDAATTAPPPKGPETPSGPARCKRRLRTPRLRWSARGRVECAHSGAMRIRKPRGALGASG